MQKTKKKTIKIKDPDLTPAKDVEGGHKRHHRHGASSLLSEKGERERVPRPGMLPV